jgi:two-component system, OmpR family, sensor histidine kinase KdpD
MGSQREDDAKDAFVAAVVHDLRTPLAAIIGLASTLQQGTIDGSEVRDIAERIGTNARKLERMVTDLLDLDRLSRGVVEPKLWPTDIGTLVERVVTESELADREVSVDVDEVVADVDESKVERIVENLLSNAMRHTPADAMIWVWVRADGLGAVIAVEDEGPGVPDERREAIFRPFNKAFGDGPGVGIGLPLVRSFAELHGGRAWVEPRDGGGASFRVWLPRQARADRTSAANS